MSYIGNQPYQVAFVSDQFSGNGSTTAFTMSVAPANTASVLVSITGVLQDPSTYSVVGTTLTFSAAPPAGTGNISTRYLGIPASGVTTTAYRTVTEFTATDGQTTFTPPSYTVGFINVYVNGSRLGSSDYTASNGTTVVLAAAATAGDLVTTESFYVSSVLNAIPATAGAVNSTYIATGAVGTTQLADAGVTQSKLGANVASNGPAFSAYQGTAQTQSISQSTETKVLFPNEYFDTNNNFSSSRFTPTVAGYYQLNASVYTAPQAFFLIRIFKNGSQYLELGRMNTGAQGMSGSAVVYANGTTDYFEIYAYSTGVSPVIGDAGGNVFVQFSGSMVRGA